MRSYRDLEVYQQGYRLALEMHRLTLGFPETERYALGDQMRRASRSIPTNLAEGWGVPTERNLAHYVGQALGSANEMAVHLDFAKDLGYLSEDQHRHWQQEYDVLGKRLYAFRAGREQRAGAR